VGARAGREITGLEALDRPGDEWGAELRALAQLTTKRGGSSGGCREAA